MANPEQLQQILSAILQSGQENAQAIREAVSGLATRSAQIQQSAVQASSQDTWSRVLPKPDVFRPSNREEELSMFMDWAWSFRQYIGAVNPEMLREMDTIESDLDKVAEYDKLSEVARPRAKQLYSFLASLMRERPLSIVKGVGNSNGYEAWRLLHRTLAPTSKARSLALLGAITQFPQFKADQIHESVLRFDELIRRYKQSSGKDVSDDLKAAVLLRAVPQQIKAQISMNLPEDVTFEMLRETLLRWDRSTQKWSQSIVLPSSSASPPSAGDEAVPMDIGRIYSGKGGKKGYDAGKGGGKDKGKSKDPGKGKGGKNDFKGKPNTKGYDSKGKNNKGGNDRRNDKGKGKGYDSCRVCGKYGHSTQNCWMAKGSQVRAVEQTEQRNQSTSQSTSQPSSQSTPGPTVKRVFCLKVDDDEPEVNFSLRMVMQTLFQDDENADSYDAHFDEGCLEHYNLEIDDPIGEWHNPDAVLGWYESEVVDNMSSGVHDPDAFGGWYESEVVDYMLHGNLCPVMSEERPVSFPGVNEEIEITLDSGADASVMPESWLGENYEVPQRVKLWDAQGAQMPLRGAQTMLIDAGDACIQERFLGTTVDAPLLSLGRLLKDGWSLQTRGESDQLCMCKEDCAIPVFYRRNSLVMKASISHVLDARQPGGNEHVNVRAIQASLDFSTGDLAQGWNFVGKSGTPVIMSKSKSFHDPSALLSTALWKFRTTLVRIGSEWELVKLHEDLSEVQELEAPLPGVLFATVTLTFMHRTREDPVDFGVTFSGMDPSASDPAKDTRDESINEEPAEASDVAPGPVIELDEGMPDPAEVSDDNGVEEPVQPRIMPDLPQELEVEGVQIGPESSASVLRQACKALGVGQSGSKKTMFNRLHNALQRRDAEDQIALEQAARPPERPANVGPVPAEPSPEERLIHEVTHVPYKPWCEYCLGSRARRDSHRSRQGDQEQSAIPCVSLDYFYACKIGDAVSLITEIKEEHKDKSKITLLVAVERTSGMMRCIPMQTKAKASMVHAAKEVLSFMSYLGLGEAYVRGDNEPSMVGLVDLIVKARVNAGLKTLKNPSQMYVHQTNGVAEQALQSIRDIGVVFLNQLQSRSGVTLELTDDIYAWAFCHGSFIHNFFKFKGGQLPMRRRLDAATKVD